MDDVSKLGPLWVNQLRKEVAARRNRAAESLMAVNPEGAYADQHRILISAANAMLAAPELLDVLERIAMYADDATPIHSSDNLIADVRAAIAKATGSAA